MPTAGPAGSDPGSPDLDIEATARESALWVQIRGEADLGNHEQLQSELAGVDLTRVREVHLVLTGLTFCDLYAFRHIVTFAARARATGLDFAAHGACPTVRTIAKVLNVTQVLHFV